MPREAARLVLVGLLSDPVQDVADTIASTGIDNAVHLGDLAEEAESRACVAAAYGILFAILEDIPKREVAPLSLIWSRAVQSISAGI
jgi:hypothetical protein